MSSRTIQKKKRDTNGVANLRPLLEILPAQGDWDDDAYLWITDRARRLIELTDGELEFLPMPTHKHQAILKALLYLFDAYLLPLGGKALFAPLRVRIRAGKFREPDLLLCLKGDDPRISNRFWTGADLVAEIVSEDDPDRDLVQKRLDYAEGKIPEYWIVHPKNGTITVLVLAKGKYREHGVFGSGEKATSVVLPGFNADVDTVLTAR
jgi:Uma2 family endonuclease